ncbi:YsnF/AvaK domain-containing protein [Psychrobacter sp. B38]|uniref:YsnF/AvaK domain-containing protein n=1 Tax=Psychrobacter sp. B38 TaxID=3143538 RepID=UPI00320EB3A1
MTIDNNNPLSANDIDNSQNLSAEERLLNNQRKATDKTGQGGYLELLEERPVINKERLDVGKVTVTKHTRTKTIEVPIELVEEYITVRTEFRDAESQDLLSGNYDEKEVLRHVEPSLDSKAVITINDKQIEIGDEPIDIVLSRQVATVTKETYAVQEVNISKTVHTHTDSIQVALKHEELDVTEEGFLDHGNGTTYDK